jgi:hypothetical protein
MQTRTAKPLTDSTNDLRCPEALASANRVISGLAAQNFSGVVQLRFEMGCLIALRTTGTEDGDDEHNQS